MPELPEVETIARKLAPRVVGRTVAAVDVRWVRTIDRPQLDAFVDGIYGAGIETVGRRGKFLVFTLDTGKVLLVHLRMSGKFRVYSNGSLVDDDYARVCMQLDNGEWLVFSDTRKFGRFYLVDDLQDVAGNLGPEPLSPDFTAAVFEQRLVGRRSEIKRLLLNQGFVAGLGNIYASEALWHAQVHPQKAANTLTPAETQRLHGAIVKVLSAGIQHGGTSLGDRQYVYPDGALGEHQQHLAVYDRAGDQCPRCGYELVRIVQGQRSTYFCPVCQKL